MALTLTSTAFRHGEAIPPDYTCDGADRSPPVRWSGRPPGTRTFVLIVDDPDAPDPGAPKMTWVHWVLYELPADTSELPAGVAPSDLPAGTREGTNSWKRTGYGGPCPPIGRHRYYHKLFALDAPLGDLHRPPPERLTAAMEGHVLANAELMGTYQRSR
jgi:Raf kinase inhibitor-like YbhB/YbcL family protein